MTDKDDRPLTEVFNEIYRKMKSVENDEKVNLEESVNECRSMKGILTQLIYC